MRAVLLVIALLAAGCTAPSPDGPPAEDGSGTGAGGGKEADGSSGPPQGIRAGDIEVTASVTHGNGTWNLTARAINQDERARDYREGCQHEWNWTLEGPDGPVPLAYATCLGFREASLEPGGRVDFAWPWNGTVWDDEERRYREAPPGEYTFRIAFLTIEDDRVVESVPGQATFQKPA